MGLREQRAVMGLMKVMEAAGAEAHLQNRPDPWHPSLELDVPDGWFVGVAPRNKKWVLAVTTPEGTRKGEVIGDLADTPEKTWATIAQRLNSRVDLMRARKMARRTVQSPATQSESEKLEPSGLSPAPRPLARASTAAAAAAARQTVAPPPQPAAEPNLVRPHLGPALVAAWMLFIATGDHSNSYYTALRVVVCGAAIMTAWASWRYTATPGRAVTGHLAMIAFIATAILFNPVAPIYADRNFWLPVDVVLAAAFGVSCMIAVPRRRPAI
ncbi:hypothetical protein J1G42_14215 [Cellulomonas sp. zg-ZUI222]|uniref:DUF6804 family protein n=1 Tax=Cellulomonas wangleii TaxID=2816956 RepID=UPI001A950201|nr:DUF6804 family protein [Cellulomonas wangleii]MBO0921978.1 hypothetical protein [Cellulomonas wangleii]